MTFEVPSEYSQLIQQAVASGAFNSPEEAFRHALELLKREQQTRTSSPQHLGEVLTDDLSADAAAEMQGVGPIKNPDEGAGEFEEEEENLDQWLTDLQRLRGQGTLRDVP